MGPDNKDRIIVTVDPDLADLIPGFLENRQADVKALEEALAQHDYEKARSLGHIMKGAGGGYGFDGISVIGAEIEQAAKENNGDVLRQQLDKLIDYLDRVEVEHE